MGTALGQTSEVTMRLGDGSGNSSLTVLFILGTRFEHSILATVRLVGGGSGRTNGQQGLSTNHRPHLENR